MENTPPPGEGGGRAMDARSRDVACSGRVGNEGVRERRRGGEEGVREGRKGGEEGVREGRKGGEEE